MGQSNSSVDKRRQVKGGILIKLVKTAFSSNETIEGQICINLEEPFQGHLLQISLQGFEETHFTYIGQHRVGQHVSIKTIHAKGYDQFVDFTIPVYDFAVGTLDSAFVIQPIQAVIPFQLTVAEKLPSSINYFFDANNNCSLKYQLVASLISTEANVRPITGSQEIFIGQQIPTYQLPNTTNSVQEPTSCWCCNSGQIKYNANLNSRQLCPNSQGEVDLDIDFSQYSNKVSGLKITLKGDLVIKANNTEKVKTFELLVKEQEINVNSINFKQKVQIPIPGNVNLSCNGSLINLKYNLIITPKIDSCLMISESKPHIIEVAINPTNTLIYDIKNIPQQMNIQAPLNWNPVLLQPSLSGYQQGGAQIQQQQMNQQQMGFTANQANSFQQQPINGQSQMLVPLMADQTQYAVQPSYVAQPILQPQQIQVQPNQYIQPQGQQQMMNQYQVYTQPQLASQQYSTNQQVIPYPQQNNNQQVLGESQFQYQQQANVQPQMYNQQQIVVQPQVYNQQQQIPQTIYQQQTYPLQQQQVYYQQPINAPVLQTMQIQPNQQPIMVDQNRALL
ncbi:hypothetical protein TTHERM_00533910 (macronuclear) [Tetrahymena thermophila SB210]|uniref:Arrestin n=1 Tax=Tetrahymena thermophila (strain SB210) TaxID=312017 RepID=Q247X7_TETTS|nr:hypothetical protein TTHERM_00533910 [Tetrahymena thermophila SB210]EAS04168.1 hypothetical protein TTHERM_00533910 [Tetrahymena thermophila SB210]|eukprot:XP_001024413.1 hypothetical protein TTHERM_00533910 [Tetrahymena thermophila SB210]